MGRGMSRVVALLVFFASLTACVEIEDDPSLAELDEAVLKTPPPTPAVESWMTPGRAEYTWRQGNSPTPMIRSADGFCFLTRITGRFIGAGESVRIIAGADGY